MMKDREDTKEMQTIYGTSQAAALDEGALELLSVFKETPYWELILAPLPWESENWYGNTWESALKSPSLVGVVAFPNTDFR